MSDNYHPYKQVILFRSDLNMRKGKIAAQVAHASVEVVLQMMDSESGRLMVDAWRRESNYAKIVLSVSSEYSLYDAQKLAEELSIPHFLVTDLGFTEFKGVPTDTALSIGPWHSDEIDKITGPQGLVTTKLA